MSMRKMTVYGVNVVVPDGADAILGDLDVSGKDRVAAAKHVIVYASLCAVLWSRLADLRMRNEADPDNRRNCLAASHAWELVAATAASDLVYHGVIPS